MSDAGLWKRLAFSFALAGAFAVLAALESSPVSAEAPPPPNDGLANAQSLGAPSLMVVDTSGATVDRGEPVPSCAPPGTAPIRRTVWYRVVTLETTLPIAAVGTGTSFRPILALYSQDSATRLTQIACSNTLSVRATVSPGQTYLLQVGAAGLAGHADGGKLALILGPAERQARVRPTSAASDEPTPGEPDIVSFDVATPDTGGQMPADRRQ